MKYCKMSRRHFLQGAGKFALSLPFLPSLLPLDAAAENPTGAKFFIHFSSDHGGLHPYDFFPDTSGIMWTANEQTPLYAGSEMEGLYHTMRHKPLSQMLTNGRISPVFGPNFNPLVSKISLIDGLGLMYGGGHQQGAMLGNMHGNDNRDFRTGIDPNLNSEPMETIDQVIAKSVAFYGAADPRTMPVLNLGGGGRSPSFRRFNGSIQPSVQTWDIGTIFDYLFGDSFGNQGEGQRISVLNRIYEDYSRLKGAHGAARRISQDDAHAVNQHLDLISQVERRLQNLQQAESCSTIGLSTRYYGPTDPNSYENAFHQATRELFATQWDIYVDLIVTAINCGLCRLFTVPLGTPTDYQGGDYHQDIAHQFHTETAQVEIRDAHTFIAERFILPLITRLNDVAASNGERLLDKGLVVWQQECWYQTHNGHNLPTFMAGSADGFFRTGYYVDYCNRSNRGLQGDAYRWQQGIIDPTHPVALLHPGLPMNRWLHTVMQSLGVTRSEYLQIAGIDPNVTPMFGYGDSTVQEYYARLTFNNTVGNSTQNVTHTAWPERVIRDSNSNLPFIVV